MNFAINVEENGKIKRRHVLVRFGLKIIFCTTMIIENSIMTVDSTTKKMKKTSFMIQMMSFTTSDKEQNHLPSSSLLNITQIIQLGI